MRLMAAIAVLALACDDGGGSTAQMQGADARPVDVDMQLADLGIADATPPDADFVADAALPDAGPPPRLPISADPGPYAVGYREIEVTYDPPTGGGPRTLRTALWFPTAAIDGSPVLYGRILARPQVFGGAEPLAVDGPVLVFSHGNGGFAEQSFFLTEYFASHGWLVAAPDHTGNTFFDINSGAVPFRELFELRPRDLSAVIDALEAIPAGDPLAGRVGNGVLVAGHSFGGYTTLAIAGAGYAVEALRAECRAAADVDVETCDYLDASAERYTATFVDPRVTAGVPLTPAGANFFRTHVSEINVPILMVTAGRDQTLPNPVEGDPLWEASDGPDAIRLDLPNAGHFSFTSFCGRLGTFGADDGCGDSFLDPAQVHRITREYALAFGRLHLEGDATDDGLLDGTDAPYAADVEFDAKP